MVVEMKYKNGNQQAPLEYAAHDDDVIGQKREIRPTSLVNFMTAHFRQKKIRILTDRQ